jgi:hypothetical protein
MRKSVRGEEAVAGRDRVDGATWRGREDGLLQKTRWVEEGHAAHGERRPDSTTWRGGEDRGATTMRMGATARQQPQPNATMRLVLTQEFKKMVRSLELIRPQ